MAKKQKKPKALSKRWELYEKDGDGLKRKNKSCPKCGAVDAAWEKWLHPLGFLWVFVMMLPLPIMRTRWKCRKCGERVECENCSVTLTYHRREERLLCHYCDYAQAVPDKCPSCSSEFLYFQGSGSEKVEDALRKRFPKASYW